MSMTKMKIFELFSAGCRHSYNSHNKTNSSFVTCFLPHLMIYQSPAFGRGLTIVAMKK